MKSKEYNVLLKTLLGLKKGKLVSQKDGDKISGTLTLFNHTFPFTGSIKENNECQIEGSFKTLLRIVPFVASGFITDKEVHLNINEERNTFELSGYRSMTGESL